MMKVSFDELREALLRPHKKLQLIARTFNGRSDLVAVGTFLNMVLMRFREELKKADNAELAILWGAAIEISEGLALTETSSPAEINQIIAARIEALYLKIERDLEKAKKDVEKKEPTHAH